MQIDVVGQFDRAGQPHSGFHGQPPAALGRQGSHGLLECLRVERQSVALAAKIGDVHLVVRKSGHSRPCQSDGQVGIIRIVVLGR